MNSLDLFFPPVLVSFKTQSCWRVLRLSPPTHTFARPETQTRSMMHEKCLCQARPGRQAAREPGRSCFRNKGNDIHGIPQQRKCGSSLLCKLHSTASSETTQTHCGHSTSICGFPTRGLAHIYQPFSRGTSNLIRSP